jgi:acyl-coenzyme A thioesterase PaaI-like protein
MEGKAMTQSKTHLGINHQLCGRPEQLGDGVARVAFEATGEMAVDERGLVHGGFVFGLADYAAMLAVNDPNVVLGSAEVRFTKPCVVGEALVAEARVDSAKGRKRLVEATVSRGEEPLFSGTFTCFVLDEHVLG